jgi:ubiquinone/menaquinone biosynthesis C-methylase UbiE
LDYNEVREEKNVWSEKARIIQDDIELRGSLKNPITQLNKSRAYIYKLFKKNKKNDLLLDLGCGNGLFTVPLAAIFNYVVGVDVSKAMIKRSRERRANLDFIMASATDLPLRDHVFDSVLSLSLLQHLRTKDNVEKALKGISRTATNDSFILLTFWDTPNSPANLIKNILKREKYNLKQSLVSRLQFTGLQFTKYVKLRGNRR